MKRIELCIPIKERAIYVKNVENSLSSLSFGKNKGKIHDQFSINFNLIGHRSSLSAAITAFVVLISMECIRKNCKNAARSDKGNVAM